MSSDSPATGRRSPNSWNAGISLTAWKSPSEVIGKPASMTSTPMLSSISRCRASPRRSWCAGALLAVAQGGVEYDDASLSDLAAVVMEEFLVVMRRRARVSLLRRSPEVPGACAQTALRGDKKQQPASSRWAWTQPGIAQDGRCGPFPRKSRRFRCELSIAKPLRTGFSAKTIDVCCRTCGPHGSKRDLGDIAMQKRGSRVTHLQRICRVGKPVDANASGGVPPINSAFDVTIVGTAPRGALPTLRSLRHRPALPLILQRLRTLLNSCSEPASTFGNRRSSCPAR